MNAIFSWSNWFNRDSKNVCQHVNSRFRQTPFLFWFSLSLVNISWRWQNATIMHQNIPCSQNPFHVDCSNDTLLNPVVQEFQIVHFQLWWFHLHITTCGCRRVRKQRCPIVPVLFKQVCRSKKLTKGENRWRKDNRCDWQLFQRCSITAQHLDLTIVPC